MRRLLRVGALLVLPIGLAVIITAEAVVGLRAAPQQQVPAVVRAGIELVRFDVIVTGKGNDVVSGLTAADFEVVEGGVRQTVSVFAGGGAAPAPELHLGILLDVSNSMARHGLETARFSATEIVNRLPEAVDYTLVLVDGCVRVSRFTRREVGTLIDRIREASQVPAGPPDLYDGAVVGDGYWNALNPESARRIEDYHQRDGQPMHCYTGGTVVWDGFDAYLRQVENQSGRHVLVAFTDAEDLASRMTFDELLRAVRTSGVTAFAVGPWQIQKLPAHRQGGVRLQDVADETAGIALYPYSRNEVEEVHRRIVKEVRSLYTLGYVSADTRQDGRWREVKIRLVRPQHQDLRIRARDGYYAAKPAQQPAPRFEVASVKPTQARGLGANIIPRAWPGGRFGADHATVDTLLWFAYGVRQDLIVGGPDWVRQEMFEISAKAENDAPADQIRLMVQSLLKDRFKLVMHMEPREMEVLALVRSRPDGPLGSGLIRIDECSAAVVIKLRQDFPEKYPAPGAGTLSACSSKGLGDLAILLTMGLGTKVLDATGVTDSFYFSLRSQLTPAAALVSRPDNADPNLPAVSTALDEPLGLKLQSRRGPVDVMVIDSVERPTED